MNPMKHLYRSDVQKRADTSRKIEDAVVGTPSTINSCFKIQDSRLSADIPVAAGVVENACSHSRRRRK